MGARPPWTTGFGNGHTRVFFFISPLCLQFYCVVSNHGIVKESLATKGVQTTCGNLRHMLGCPVGPARDRNYYLRKHENLDVITYASDDEVKDSDSKWNPRVLLILRRRRL